MSKNINVDTEVHWIRSDAMRVIMVSVGIVLPEFGYNQLPKIMMGTDVVNESNYRLWFSIA